MSHAKRAQRQAKMAWFHQKMYFYFTFVFVNTIKLDLGWVLGRWYSILKGSSVLTTHKTFHTESVEKHEISS